MLKDVDLGLANEETFRHLSFLLIFYINSIKSIYRKYMIAYFLQ